MRKRITLVLVVVLVAVLPMSSGESSPDPAPLIVVMDIETGPGVQDSMGVPLTMVVMDELMNSGAYRVMGRGRRDEILKEHDFKSGDCSGADCYLKAGKLLGVAFVVIGRVDKIGYSFLLMLQRVNVSTGNVEASAKKSASGDESGLVEAAVSAAKKLYSPVAPPPARSPEEPRAPEGKCPQDMVYIPEGNFCMDRFEYPNRKGERPEKYVAFKQAVELCHEAGKRLPTEAEFEAACMGGRKLQFGYGDKYKKGACNVGGGIRRAKVAAAGDYQDCTNDYGVFDMIGNMWEWTDDGSGAKSELKGGSYTSTLPSMVNCSERFNPQEQQDIGWGGGYDFGFRCAKNAE